MKGKVSCIYSVRELLSFCFDLYCNVNFVNFRMIHNPFGSFCLFKNFQGGVLFIGGGHYFGGNQSFFVLSFNTISD